MVLTDCLKNYTWMSLYTEGMQKKTFFNWMGTASLKDIFFQSDKSRSGMTLFLMVNF